MYVIPESKGIVFSAYRKEEALLGINFEMEEFL